MSRGRLRLGTAKLATLAANPPRRPFGAGSPVRISRVPRVLPELERRFLHTLVGLPTAWLLRLSGGEPTRGDAGVLDPTVQLILALQRRRGLSGLAAATPDETRARMRRQTALVAGVPTPVGRVRELSVPGAEGPLAARHYAPLDAATQPAPWQPSSYPTAGTAAGTAPHNASRTAHHPAGPGDAAGRSNAPHSAARGARANRSDRAKPRDTAKPWDTATANDSATAGSRSMAGNTGTVGNTGEPPHAGDGAALALRVHQAQAAQRAAAAHHRPSPLLVFFHGGGFVAGDLDSHDEPCRLLCRHSGAHVLSVEYRLAPEHPFPAAVLDAHAVTQWALRHAAELGADPNRVAVAGDSAGANLATVACLMARRREEPLPAVQILVYPPTDHHTPWKSRQAFAQGLVLTGEDIEYFHGHYAAGENPDDERHSPLRSTDLSELPATLLITAAFDPLRDEGEAYADALRAAGNHVVSWRVPGMVHGFLNLTTLSDAAHDAVVEIAGAIRALLASSAGPSGGPSGAPSGDAREPA